VTTVVSLTGHYLIIIIVIVIIIIIIYFFSIITYEKHTVMKATAGQHGL